MAQVLPAALTLVIEWLAAQVSTTEHLTLVGGGGGRTKVATDEQPYNLVRHTLQLVYCQNSMYPLVFGFLDDKLKSRALQKVPGTTIKKPSSPFLSFDAFQETSKGCEAPA